MTFQDKAVGAQLRSWRHRRRLSQLDLALEANISSRHLSFIETGRSSPSRNVVLRIAECLELPLRERNGLLLAAGFAPDYPERTLDDPLLGSARNAVERIIDCHMPFPALAVDRYWDLLHANNTILHLLAGVADRLLSPRINVLRLSLHPEGLARRIVNLADWKAHVLHRLGRQVRASADPRLEDLLDEIARYPAPASARPPGQVEFASPLILTSPAGDLSFLSTTTVFGTANDVTISEITIESFFPTDRATADRLAEYDRATVDARRSAPPA